jgi:hypothetical protein
MLTGKEFRVNHNIISPHPNSPNTQSRRFVDATPITVCTWKRENSLANRFFSFLSSSGRQIFAVLMILFGSVLAANSSVGPCGGTSLAAEPFPAFFVCLLGLELILSSYFVVKSLKVEADFRVVIYLFLVLWSLTLLIPAMDLLRSGPRTPGDVNELFFTLLRGTAALANLFVFYKWAGAKNMITRIW